MVLNTLRTQAEGLVKSLAGTAAGVAPGIDADTPERVARAAKVLVEAGVLRAERPDRALAAARTLLGWKLTPAAGFVVSAVRTPDDIAISDEIGELTFAETD